MLPPRIPLSLRSLVFWRHIVGIAFLLLLQHPSLYENGSMFFGLWFGTAFIAFSVAGIFTGLLYLFFANQLAQKTWRIFVGIAWSMAILQLFGEWFLPNIVQKVATAPYDHPTTAVPSHKHPESPAIATGRCRGLATPSLEEFLMAARPANPGVADASLIEYWVVKYSKDWDMAFKKCLGM